MDAWKRGFKARLRDVVRAADPERPEGSQRKLAKVWLGDAADASQVSNWCSAKREDVPEGAEKLHQLRERCSVDLNWLLSGPPTPGVSEKGAWPASRRQQLGEELNAFALQVMAERIIAKRLPPFGTRWGYPDVSVWKAVHGDFLRLFTAEVWRLTDALCAVEGWDAPSPKAKAELFRRYGAAVKRGQPNATHYVRERVATGKGKAATGGAARRAGASRPSGSPSRR